MTGICASVGKVIVLPVFDSTILGKGRKSHLLRAALLDSINDSTRMKAERVDGTERGIWTLGRSVRGSIDIWAIRGLN